MDTNLLVESKIVDGQRLINLLVREGFEVTVAFWAQQSEGGLWDLWIASPSARDENRREAIGTVYAAIAKIPDCQISLVGLTLIGDYSPIAQAAIAARDHGWNTRALIHFSEKRLGNLDIEDAYIYPRRLPWEVRALHDGRWQVLISQPDDVWLVCDSEEEARAIAAAPVLEYEAMERLRSGPQFAAELERTAQAMSKYRMGFGSRFFGRRADEVRRQENALQPASV